MTPNFLRFLALGKLTSAFRVFGNVVRRPGVAVTACLALAVAALCGQVTSSSLEKAEKFHQQGLTLVTAGRIDDAIATFKQGLQMAPQDARLLDAAGAAYSLKGDLESAQRYFVESLRANPDSISTRQNLGITLFSLGDYDQASKQFTTIYNVAGNPRVVASLFLGLIAQKRSDCTQALPMMEASSNLLYQYPDALLSYADCQYQVGGTKRVEEALAAFERLPGITPAQYLQAADLYLRLGQNEKAQQDRSKAQPKADETPALALKHAMLLETANRFDEAQRFLEEQVASQTTFALLFELAKVAKQRGDFAVSMKSLKRAAEIEPGREDSYLEFSTICADHGNDQLALDSAEIGLDHVPASYRLTVQKGVVQEKLGHLNDAEATLKGALGMQSDNSIARLSLAVVQAHSGRPELAEQTLSEAIRQFPDNYYMHYFRGKLLLHFPDIDPRRTDLRDLARHSLEKAIQLNPKYADSYYQLSDVYLSTAPKLAEQALRKCLQLDPNHIPAQYSLARLYVRTGRKAEGEALIARLKTQQRTEELQQQKQLRIDVAQN